MLLSLHTKHTLQASAVVVLAAFALTSATPAASSAQETSSTFSSRNSAEWAWPVDSPHPVVQSFIAPKTTYSAGHRGIDIAAPLGAIVRAPASGVVRFSGFVVNRNLISIDHGGGIVSSFEPVLSDLTEGSPVSRGQQIGVLQSGHCRTPCLHLGARLNAQYVSPLNYLGGLELSVLLPTRQIR